MQNFRFDIPGNLPLRGDFLPMGNSELSLTEDWGLAVALRQMAMVENGMPFYLLAPEVSALLHYLPDIRQRTFFETLWNTGARPNEALSLTPNKIKLDGSRPYIVLKTLKQRNRGRGRLPNKKAKYPEDQDVVTAINVERAVPVMDSNYREHLRQLIATFSITKDNVLWPESPDTISRWLKRAIVAANSDGVTFSIQNITPKTFRHSFAMHLLFNKVHPKVLQAYMGHQRGESTEVYTKVFTLDIGVQKNVTFSYDAEKARTELRNLPKL